jgi:hypothetical protein
MSTDYVAVCDRCRAFIHAGQRSGMTFSFGYSASDEAGRTRLGDFIMVHVDHERLFQEGGTGREGVRFVNQQCDSYLDYKNIEED